MKERTAFITGADGFIGSHLVEALVKQGFRVRALAYYNSFDSRGWLDCLPHDVLADVEVVMGDIRDGHLVERLVQDVDLVFHLAALIGIPFSYLAPDLYVQTNIQGTLNVLNAVRKWGRAKLIHTSTSEVYGSAQSVPITESHPLNPQSPYAASKLAADHLALSYYASFEIPVTVIRPFNTFGPRQSTRAIIPTLLTQMRQSTPIVKVGLTTPTRDFTFVTDTASGFLAAAMSDAGCGRVIQLGSNFEVSVAELITAISELLGVQPIIETESARLRPSGSEVHRLWADNTLAKTLLGWKPAYEGKEGFLRALQITADWFNEPANASRYRLGSYTV
jgi:NAD dependent epimerase/dehydratase